MCQCMLAHKVLTVAPLPLDTIMVYRAYVYMVLTINLELWTDTNYSACIHRDMTVRP